MKVPTNVSESVRKLNPHLYPVGAVSAKVPQSTDLPALAGIASGEKKSRKRVAKRGQPRTEFRPIMRVSFTAFRRTGRTLDSDNLVGGLKPMRDAIAQWFGIDDADRLIEWEYSQTHTKGREGTAVKIEML